MYIWPIPMNAWIVFSSVFGRTKNEKLISTTSNYNDAQPCAILFLDSTIYLSHPRLGSILSLLPSPLAVRLSDLISSRLFQRFFEKDFVKTGSIFEVRKEGMRKTLNYKDVSVIHCSRDGVQFTRMKFFEEKNDWIVKPFEVGFWPFDSCLVTKI